MKILVNHSYGAYGILLPDMGDLIAPYYDSTATYSLGDYVLFQGKLYKCTTAVTTAETFDPTKWTATTIMAEQSGGTPTFSFARAVYDAGDTVTATDGTTTLTSDTSGDYVFAIPNSGTWTFSDGTTTITKSLTTYGEAQEVKLWTLLPASTAANVLAEIKSGLFKLDNNIGEGFKATNSNTFSLAEDGSLVTSATGHVYYDLNDVDVPATIYFVGKCADTATSSRCVLRINQESSGEAPGFYKAADKKLYITRYGGDASTNIMATSLFACAMTVDSSKAGRWYANNTYSSSMNVSHSGRYVYFSGNSSTPKVPTGSTYGGEAMTISYIGIVNGAEDATTIATNIAAIMAAFGIA